MNKKEDGSKIANKLQVVKLRFPIVSTILLMIMLILFVDYFRVPNPAILLLIGVVFSTFSGGYVYGAISGALTFVYCAYFFSEHHSFYQYSNENLYKIIVIMIAVFTMIVMVGILKQQVIGQKMKLEETNHLLYKRTIVDELTGLYNYRYFLEQLENLWVKNRKNQSELSLAMVDIDFFKKYNDYYGHQKGNECINKISDILRTNMRCPGGFVARYGGEEFVIVMPDTGAKEAKKMLENIRVIIEESKIEHKASEFYRNVTVSIGIATIIPSKEMAYDIIIKRADYVLYEAKKEGRNRVLEENEIDTRANVKKADGTFVFQKEQQEAYERMILPLGIFQLVEDKVVALLVSDGLYEMTGAGRLELIEHYNTDMFGNVHPEDVAMLAREGHQFSRHEGDYNVTYRTRFFGKEYHKIHVVGKFQTVGEGTRVAFLIYTKLKETNEKS